MQDVTDLMRRYRECSRNLWNTYLGDAMEEAECCEVDRTYDQIRKLLFDVIVSVRLTGIEGSETPLIVEPMPSLTILIKRPSGDGNSYWDQEPHLAYENGLMQLMFIDFYDFFEGRIRDFRFYRCRVTSFPTRPEYQGREALVDVVDARVLYDAETPQRASPRVTG
jgi:hypothetical protein